MALWIVIGLMAIAAAAFLLQPVPKARWVSLASGVSVASIALAFALYSTIGSPGISSVQAPPDVNEMVASLAERLESEPDDIEGWKMLGRSYISLGRFEEASDAFRKAIELEDGQNAQTLVDLGESLLAGAGQTMSVEVVSIFENALALDPSNPSALFWGGIASANRGNTEQAAERWEQLLETNPPEQIRAIIEQRVAEWRGTPLSTTAAAGPVTVSLSLGEQVARTLPPDTVVFVIARDPQQPAPPVAVVRRQLRELPAEVSLSDRDAMIPGRLVSNFDTLEIIARVSVTGEPAAQSGDWFATGAVSPGGSLELVIDQQVP